MFPIKKTSYPTSPPYIPTKESLKHNLSVPHHVIIIIISSKMKKDPNLLDSLESVFVLILQFYKVISSDPDTFI